MSKRKVKTKEAMLECSLPLLYSIIVSPKISHNCIKQDPQQGIGGDNVKFCNPNVLMDLFIKCYSLILKNYITRLPSFMI